MRSEIQKITVLITTALCVLLLAPFASAQTCANPTRNKAAIIFNSSTAQLQYCDGSVWKAMGPMPSVPPPSGCPNVGDLCPDGSVYAGLSPDGNVPMYTTPADQGVIPWNNGNSSGYVTTSQTSATTGEANTTALIGLDSDSATGGTQPHLAAQTCADLTDHGQTDWYLPAKDELNVLYSNKVAIGGFNLSGLSPAGYYRSSSESNNINAWYQRFSTGVQNFNQKQAGLSVRCVRKERPQPTSIVPVGLVGHWRLDETSGTTAIDYASSNNGTMQGGLDPATDSVPGRVGTALNFGGDVNKYSIAVPYNSDFVMTGDLTLSAWIKHDTSLEGIYSSHRIISMQSNSPTRFYFIRTITSGSQRTIQFAVTGDTQGDGATGTVDVNDGQWHHIAGVLEGSTYRVYVDGVLDDSITDTGPPGTVDTTVEPLRIGGVSTVAENYAGDIDDVRVYNRALSADEIKQIYQATEAKLRYNTKYRVAEYFNGDEWVATGPLKYVPNAVNFDGTNDYLEYNAPLTGAADSTKWSGSVWLRLNSSLHQVLLDDDDGTGFYIDLDSTFGFEIIGNDLDNGPEVLRIRGPIIQNLSAGWHHIMWSLDLSDVNKRHIYVDGVDQLLSAPTYNTSGVIDFTRPATRVGRGAANRLNGDIADFWVDFGTYIDLSVEANRRKFISDTGMPMYLGPNGSIPTGSPPDIFLSGDTADWHTNKGTGGGFTENGELTDTIFSTYLDCSGIGDDYAYSSSGDTCYYYEQTGAGNWLNAQAACESNGGHLVNINDSVENSLVASLSYVSAETYIGGKDFDDDGRWRWVDENGNPDQQFWQGADGGTGITGVYENWAGSQPNQTGQDCTSILMNNAFWYDTGCNSNFPYICEITARCSNPERDEGTIIFNTSFNVMQYCNGEDWVKMGP